MWHQVRVGNQYAWRVAVGFEYPDRFAGLNQQRFVFFQRFQGGDNFVVAVPVTRGAANTAVHHQLMRVFRHFRIEVVHQHAQRRFGQPAFCI
ncbi:hypothetical protein D3C78_1498900 [compost metagenome]